MKRLAPPLAVLLFMSAFAQEARPKREGMISGRVVADDGQPMEGARVIAVSVGRRQITGPPQSSVCDADGNFKVTGLAHGVYALQAQAPGYVSVQAQSRKYRNRIEAAETRRRLRSRRRRSAESGMQNNRSVHSRRDSNRAEARR